MNSFKTFHPIVNFVYFVCVIGFSMFFMHPACLLISMAGAFLYLIKLKGKKGLIYNLKVMIPVIILTMLFNPLFNHEGVTIIGYFSSGNPLTLESIAYGMAAGSMLVTVILWFACYNEIMTSDKFIYLFGRIIPSISLILSMTLRLVPKFKAQLKVIIHAQKCIGKDIGSGSVLTRIKNGVNILSIMVTWALEDSVETADSMKSRGYGLEGRTAFSIYHWSKRDGFVLGYIVVLAACVMTGYLTGQIYYTYFPMMNAIVMGPIQLSLFMCYILLCITPLMIEMWEERQWKVS